MPNQNPEQLARDRIDAALRQCGWTIQDKKKINLVSANLPNAIDAVTTKLHIFRNTTSLAEPGFLLAYYNTPKFLSNGIKKMTGLAGQKRAPTEYFSTNPFPLPPIKEQHRIVKKINQMMFQCDELEKFHAESNKKQLQLLDSVLTFFT